MTTERCRITSKRCKMTQTKNYIEIQNNKRDTELPHKMQNATLNDNKEMQSVVTTKKCKMIETKQVQSNVYI